MPRGQFSNPEERRQKLSLALSKKPKSVEHKKKLSLSHLGQTPWNKNLTKCTDARMAKLAEKVSKTLTVKEILTKVCAFCQKEFQTKRESRKFCSCKCATNFNIGKQNWSNGLTKETDERIAYRASKMKGRKPWNIGMIGVYKLPQNSVGMLERWQDPEYVKKTTINRIKAQGKCPNKFELKFIKFLNDNFPSEWQFVGDGQLLIENKCPDFWNGDHKLIEIWGDYWHKDENSQDSISLFKKCGYDTLVIWESEFKENKNLVISKIKEFCK